MRAGARLIDIARRNNTTDTLTLQYFNDPGVTQTYNVDVLPVGARRRKERPDIGQLAKNGKIDTEYYTRSEEVALRDQLDGYRRITPGQ